MLNGRQPSGSNASGLRLWRGRDTYLRRAQSFVRLLTRMLYHYFIALSHRSTRGMHEKMLECFLHCRGTLRFSFANEPCDGSDLHSGLVYVQLEVLEVSVGCPQR